jgi:hypothetical protein
MGAISAGAQRRIISSVWTQAIRQTAASGRVSGRRDRRDPKRLPEGTPAVEFVKAAALYSESERLIGPHLPAPRNSFAPKICSFATVHCA